MIKPSYQPVNKLLTAGRVQYENNPIRKTDNSIGQGERFIRSQILLIERN
jgi:hypothetical protein